MRKLIAWTLTLVVAGWSAQPTSAQTTPPATKPRTATPAAAPVANPAAKPQPPAAAPADPAAIRAAADADAKGQAEMESVLAEWEKRSKKIISLDVGFDRIDRSPGFGDQYYRGRAMLQSPDLACLEFTKYKLDPAGKPKTVTGKDGKPTVELETDPYTRIVCTGTEVLQYEWEEKKIFIHPLDKQARLKALQQGPLPFLFNMKAAEAKQRYGMTLLKQDARDYLIAIIPREEIDKDSFSQAFLWLSKETFLPNQLVLRTTGEKEQQEFLFSGKNRTIQPNAAMDKNLFVAGRYPGWKVIVNPGGNAAGPVAPAPRRAVPQQGARPAMKPQ